MWAIVDAVRASVFGGIVMTCIVQACARDLREPDSIGTEQGQPKDAIFEMGQWEYDGFRSIEDSNNQHAHSVFTNGQDEGFWGVQHQTSGTNANSVFDHEPSYASDPEEHDDNICPNVTVDSSWILVYCAEASSILPNYKGLAKHFVACVGQASQGVESASHVTDAFRFLNYHYSFNLNDTMMCDEYPDDNYTESFIYNNSNTNLDILDTWTGSDNDGTPEQFDELCVSKVSYSVLRQPLYELCSLTYNEDEALDQRIAKECGFAKNDQWHISVINKTSNTSCIKNPRYFFTVQMKWFGCKLNYLFAVFSVIMCLYLGKQFYVDRYSKSKIMLLLCNAIWVLWRLLETLHEDTKWKDKFSYMCLAMHFIQTFSQTMSLYLLSGISTERLYAVASPIHYRHNMKNRGYRMYIFVTVALVVGVLCYALNIASVLTMNDKQVRQTCRLSVSDSASEYLGFTVAAKVFTLVFVFVLPCIMLIYSNLAIIIHIKKPTNTLITSSVRGKSVKKLDQNLSILFLSSVFILCCLAKPILDIHMAARVHSNGNGVERSVGEVTAKVVFVNLEIVASAISTLVGVRFGAWVLCLFRNIYMNPQRSLQGGVRVSASWCFLSL